jgi:ABC-type arginine transport system permease subunit
VLCIFQCAIHIVPGLLVAIFIFYALKRTLMSFVHIKFNSTVSFNFTNCFCSVSTFRCVMSFFESYVCMFVF